MSEKGLQILAKKNSIPFAKGALLILGIIAYLESNIEFHLKENLPISRKY